MKQQLKLYIKENLIKEKRNVFQKFKKELFEEKNIFHKLENTIFEEEFLEEKLYEYESSQPRQCTVNIKDYINENKNKYNDFQTLLFKLIDKRNLTDPEVYNKVHIDRRLFSKIRSDNTYHPSKETVILLGISLELTESELEQLLESASYSLPKNNYYDLIIRFCFINKIYKLTEINDLLDEYKCKLFNY